MRSLSKNFFSLVLLLGLASGASAQKKFNPINEDLKDINPTDVIHWEAVGGRIVKDKTIEIGLRLRTEQEFALYTNKVSFTGPMGFTITKKTFPKTTKIMDPLGTGMVPVYTGGDFLLTFRGVEKLKQKNFHVNVKFLGCTSRICLMPYVQTLSIPIEGAPANFSAPDISAVGNSKHTGFAEDRLEESDDGGDEIAGARIGVADPHKINVGVNGEMNEEDAEALAGERVLQQGATAGPNSQHGGDELARNGDKSNAGEGGAFGVNGEDGVSVDGKNSVATASGTLEEEWAAKLKSGDFSLWMLFVVVFLGGLLTNLTPCVAPMIPITVRLLANQNFSPLLNASLYAGGILITYTALGTVATLSGGAFGTFMSSVPLNIAFAILMAILGMTMIGFGNLTFLQTIGSRIGTGKPSAKNTFFMGAAAGLVAAPCTGPILGALLAYSAGANNPAQSIALMFVYSLGFSLPYVFLGSAASKSSKMRVSPKVQVAIKIVFAGVMFGLSFYYLRVPAYDFFKSLKPLWPNLTTIGLVTGTVLGLACLIKMVHNKYLLALPALALGLGLFAGSQWLTGGSAAEGSEGFAMLHSEAEAFAAAEESGKPVLIDNWAEWCEACKKMDVTTFKDPKVVEELNANWIVAKLDLTESNDVNDAHLEKYGIQGLPTLVLIWPSKGDKKHNIVGFVSAAGLLNQLTAFKEP